MSGFSISSLFPFCWLKIDGFDKIVGSNKGIAMFTTVSFKQGYINICYKYSSGATAFYDLDKRTFRDLNFGISQALVSINSVRLLILFVPN